MSGMPTVAPWTVLGSEVAFADPWLRVRSDHCRTADGDVIGPFHVIEALDWVTIVPLTQDSLRLLVVREYRHGVGAVLTGLPGGLVDPQDGNDPHAAARAAAERELREETGYGGGQLESLARLHPNPSNQTNTAHCFLATGLVRRASPEPGGKGEAQEVAEVEFAGILHDLRDGRTALHAVHAAALWSAAARIAADRTGRFGPLATRLRRILSGESARCRDSLTRETPTASTVGG